MTTTERGRAAETKAAAYLEARGYEIIDRNWRTRYCELDLVARADGIVHFLEVKYRANPNQGTGFDYITHDKQARLMRAATSWNQQHRSSAAYQIDAISVMGELDNPIIEWLQNVVTS